MVLVCCISKNQIFEIKTLKIFLSETTRHRALILGTVKPVLSGHSKIDKTKVLKTNGSLMVESIAECSLLFVQIMPPGPKMGPTCESHVLHRLI